VIDATYEKRSIAISSNIHPSGVRQAHAQKHRDRDRRPATPSRPRPNHRRPRQLPPRPSHLRKGGQAPDLNPRRHPRGGEKRWPPTGRNHGRQWGEKMAVVGEKQMAVDNHDLSAPGVDDQPIAWHRRTHSQLPNSQNQQGVASRASVQARSVEPTTCAARHVKHEAVDRPGDCRARRRQHLNGSGRRPALDAFLTFGLADAACANRRSRPGSASSKYRARRPRPG
jgi:hypothetical protein